MLLMVILGFFWFVNRCLLLQLLSRFFTFDFLFLVFNFRKLVHQSKCSWFRRLQNFIGIVTVG